MKTRAILTFAVVIGAIAVCLGMAKPPEKGRPIKINVDENCIQIPGREISQSDQEKVKAIFEKYDQWFLKTFPKRGERSAIYKIQPYENGEPQRPLGDMKIDKTSSEADTYMRSNRLTGWTTQIGLCKPVGMKCTSGGPVQCLRPEKSHELVREIAPILKKYSRQ